MTGYQIQYKERLGRHLVALRSFSAGEVVLQQDPYAFVLYDDQVPTRCDYCCCLCEQPLRCSKSKLARYCSREHQKKAWKAGFNVESNALAALYPKVPPATMRLAARCFWRKERDSPQSTEGTTSSFQQVLQLQHHWEQLDLKRRVLYAQMAALTQHYMAAAAPAVPAAARDEAQKFSTAAKSEEEEPGTTNTQQGSPTTRETAQLLARFACNNHTICDDELRPIGVGLYPVGALINHSCQPNCVQLFNGSRIMFRALRDIRPGDQLTISYVELAATRLERRQQLLYQYFFDVDGRGPGRQVGGQQQQQAGKDTQNDGRWACTEGERAPSQQQQQEQEQRQDHTQQNGGSRWEGGRDDGGGLKTGPGAEVGAEPCSQQSQRQQQQQEDPHHQQQQEGQQDGMAAGCIAWLQAVAAPPGAPPPEVHTLPGGAQIWNIRSLGGSSALPWPVDPSDAKLCQVMLGGQPLPGGVQLVEMEKGLQQEELLIPGVADIGDVMEDAEATSAGLQAAGALGVSSGSSGGRGEAGEPDLLRVSEMEGEDIRVMVMGLDLNARQRLMDQQLKRLMGGAGGSGEQRQHQQQDMVVLRWGDWPQQAPLPSGRLAMAGGGAADLESGPESRLQGAAGGGGEAVAAEGADAACPLVVAAAELLLRIHAELQQAEQLLQVGKPAAAADLLSQTVNLKTLVRSSEAPPAAAETAGVMQVVAAYPRRGGVKEGEVILGPCHVLRMRVLAALLRAAIDAGDRWGVALGAAQALTPIYQLVYPKVWPVLGLHLAAQAKLEMLLEHPAAAAKTAAAAMKVLQVTHPGSDVVQQVLHVGYEARQELRHSRALG